jgi:DNA-binding protein YbaB
MDDAMDAERRLADYRHRVDEIERRAIRAQQRLVAAAETATSSDGAVTLTVNPTGALLELTIGPRAEELSRVQLAAAILATARRAQAAAAQQAAEVMRPLLGEDSAAMAFLRSPLAAPGADGPQQ